MSGKTISLKMTKGYPPIEFKKLASEAEAEAIEEGCTGHTLFFANDANGQGWAVHSRLGIAWPFNWPATTQEGDRE